MKNLINNKFSKLLFLPLIILMTFTACQNEITDVTGPNEQETLVANSQLANLMQATSTRDGSFDNIIDAANCISINLPVTVIVNGLEITIDSEEDLAVIEAIFDEFDDDVDELEIVFPITIILNDYTEVTINNYDELEAFIDECNGENEVDDDIECIDFQYPITISIFNSDFDVIDTVTINSDEELYEFIDELEGGQLASINFPVTMILADGSELVVNNNEELQAAIEAAEDTCDEDDDNDYNDDDHNDIPIGDLEDLMVNCTWKVDDLEVNDQDLDDQYNGYVFDFNSNGTVVATDPNGGTHEGTWELYEADSGIKLNLQMNDLTDFNNEMWLLHEIEEHEGEFKIEFRQGINELSFEKYECGNDTADCTEEQVDAYLMECAWVAGFNGGDNFNDYRFMFNANQELIVHNTITDDEILGTWMTTMNTNNNVVITLQVNDPLSDFNGEWVVVECDEGRIKVFGPNGDDLYIVFERDCESDVCSEQDVDMFLMECEWYAVNFNGDDHLITFELDFNNQQELTITNTTNNEVINAMWSTSGGANGVLLEISNVAGPDIQAINGTWVVVECNEIRLKLENDNGDFFVIERECS